MNRGLGPCGQSRPAGQWRPRGLGPTGLTLSFGDSPFPLPLSQAPVTSAASEVFYPGHFSCHLTQIRTTCTHARTGASFSFLAQQTLSQHVNPAVTESAKSTPPTFRPLSMSDPDRSQEGPWGRKDGEKIAPPDLCGAWHLTWPFSCLCFSEQAWGEGSYCSRRPTLQKGLKLGMGELRHLHLGPESLSGTGEVVVPERL